MASAASSDEATVKYLDDDGFVILQDTTIGEQIGELERRGFPFTSDYGLDFLAKHILGNAKIQTTVETVLGKCALAHWLRYMAYPGHIVCFRAGGPQAGRRALLVHLWSRGSQAVYYSGSHHHHLPTEKGGRLLWEIQAPALADVGCSPALVEFPDGGVVLLDARVGYEIKSGYTITLEFATEDIIKNWPKMRVSAELAKKIESMQSEAIRVNYELL